MEEILKQILLKRGFTEETLLNNRGLTGAVIDEMHSLVGNPQTGTSSLDIVNNDKKYTTDEVKQLFKHFVKSVDFMDFTREYGLSGWKELDKWLEQNIK